VLSQEESLAQEEDSPVSALLSLFSPSLEGKWQSAELTQAGASVSSCSQSSYSRGEDMRLGDQAAAEEVVDSPSSPYIFIRAPSRQSSPTGVVMSVLTLRFIPRMVWHNFGTCRCSCALPVRAVAGTPRSVVLVRYFLPRFKSEDHGVRNISISLIQFES
jgi:hypothetical protein